MFSGGGKIPTSEWFLRWLRYGLYQIGKVDWESYSVRSCRKGSCSAATQARMPEHFTDTLGNWKSRAKETYRRTMLSKAQAQFCEYLGSAHSHRQEPAKPVSSRTLTAAQQQVRISLQEMHGLSLPDSKALQLKVALRRMHASVTRGT